MRLLVSRILKYSLVGLTTGTSIYYLHKNDYSFSHIGIVRFARVGVVVSSFSNFF